MSYEYENLMTIFLSTIYTCIKSVITRLNLKLLPLFLVCTITFLNLIICVNFVTNV